MFFAATSKASNESPNGTRTQREGPRFTAGGETRGVRIDASAGCTAKAPPVHVQNALAKIHADVLAKYYGCGLFPSDAASAVRRRALGFENG